MQSQKGDRQVSNRIDWIDIARCFAIICVVLNHSIENTYILSVENMSAFPLKTHVFAMGLFTFGRLGVPIFLMITGYLLLDREWNTQMYVKFLKSNWLDMFLCTELWWIIYDIFLTLYNKVPFNMVHLIQELLFLRQVDLPHTWYMTMILGMYILLPLVGISLQQVETRYLLFPLLFYSVYSFGYPIISLLAGAMGENVFLQLSLGFSGGVWVIHTIWVSDQEKIF